MELVPGKKHLDQSRASSRCDECGSGLRESDSQGQVQLDVEPSGLCPVEFSNGSLQGRSFASRLTHQLPHFFSWRPDLEATAIDDFTQDWSQLRGYANPPWCLMPVTHQTTEDEGPTDHPSMEDTARVPSPSGNAGGIPQDFTQEARPNVESNQSGIHHDSGPRSSHMAYLRDSFQSRGFSETASKLLLTSWRAKTTSNCNSLFNKWASWCEQRDRNPIDGHIEDIVNF